VRPKTIERKNKNKQNPINAAPRVRRCSLIWDRYPMARRPLYYFLMLWKNGAFLPKISNPRFKNYYSTLTVLVWLQLSISFRLLLLLRTFRVVMHPNFRCLKIHYYYCNCLSDYTLASRTPNLKSHDVNKSSFKTVHSFITESIPTFGESIPLLLLPTLISKFVNSSRAKSERENCKATAIQKHFYHYYLRTYYCKNSLKLGSLRT